jgi:hypothetical protein
MKYIQLFEKFNGKDMAAFLFDKKPVVRGNHTFLYHGTRVHPLEFSLVDDWDGNSGNVYDTDLPEGFLFLTDSFQEASFYGRYVIPCELKYTKRLVIKVASENPSREFDDDFSGYGKHGMFTKFINGNYDVLEVKGLHKSTFLTSVDNVIPRTDLAAEFYGLK